jgi:putative nucleotidyltransferase with HDIG domain
MHQLAIFSDLPTNAETLHRQLKGAFELRCHSFKRIPNRNPDLYTVIDTSLKDASRLFELKEWVAKKPKDGKVIFVVDKASWMEEARAYALGATHVVHRPINRRDLLAKVWGDFSALAGDDTDFRKESSAGVVKASDTLQTIFSAACFGGYLDSKTINIAGDEIISEIGSQGLSNWIDTVRKHHSQTYQHCLLVTGLAVAFGQQLGIGHKDRQRLSFAGLLHDIGKARIPVSILEKPGPLDQNELAVMKNHPQLGIEALATVPGLQPEMLDMVLHHHEYLDGSGYPHGLRAHEISDLVRMMTIADVFGALIERRSYKQPLSGDAAYQTLLDMGPKLDKDLVREFHPVALLRRQS